MVFFEVPDAAGDARAFLENLKTLGMHVNPPPGRRIWMVTYCGIGHHDIETAFKAVKEAFG